jgi:hypothetical protein
VGTAAADRVEAYVALDLAAVLVGFSMDDDLSGTPTRKGGPLVRTATGDGNHALSRSARDAT